MNGIGRVERHFARDEQGREIFTAPWGRAYLVVDAETGARLRRILKRSPLLYSIGLSAVVTPLVISGRPWYWIFAAAPFLAAIDPIRIYRITRGLQAVRFGESR